MWRSTERTPDGFATFYAGARERLLLQCYALTGDLAASQRAVRDAMVVAWHHWAKVSRLEDPEDWVRPLAWTRAQRRGQARRWARQHDVDPEARDTLEALARLPTSQRRMLLLSLLTATPFDHQAREAGLTRPAAERDLHSASTGFAEHRGVAPGSIRPHLEQLGTGTAGTRWPRASIVMRAGAARRRGHTALGVVAVVAVLAVTGSLVTESGDAHPALATKGLSHGGPRDAVDVPRSGSAASEPDPLTVSALVGTTQVAQVVTGQWTQGPTSRNTEGTGLIFTCQAARYADPRGLGVLVRTFTGIGPKGGALTAGESAEASADAATAQTAYTTALSWYAGCASPRVQLVSTHPVTGVGDQAALLVLRSWSDPETTQVVGVARTGRLTTTVVTTQLDGARRPAAVDLGKSATLLGAAVTGLCTLPGHGACTTAPAAQDAPPYPVGAQPALLTEADLPPVTGVAAPWAGTDPAPATTNPAATRCDDADFSGLTGAVTRTFVIPSAQRLSTEFGLTETAGAASPDAARAFVATVRKRLGACAKKDFGTKVDQISGRSSKEDDLTVWRLDIEVSKRQTVHFLMAIMRKSGVVAQLTFVPSADATVTSGDFWTLAERAQQRLAYLMG